MTRLRTAAVTVLCLALALVSVPSAQAATDLGVVGPSFIGASAPTAEKPQSKLWFNDGIWWGSLYSAAARDFHIHRLEPSTQTWVDTGVLIDTRDKSKADTLWDGGKLYIASAGPNATTAGDAIQLRRYSYAASTRTYTLDPGFPVTPVTGGAEAVVMDRDTTGRIWVTYTRDSKVYVTRTDTAGGSWITPYVVPVPGANDLSSDDISAVVAFDGKIGILWGNQNKNAYYFAVHTDGAPDSAWSREVAYAGPEFADDHINVKQLQADAEGRIFAVVKTSRDLAQDPLNVVLVRTADGSWDTDNVMGRKQDNETRAILLLDGQNEQVYTFAVAPCCSGGTVYMKKVSFQALANGNPYANGLGTPFLSSPSNPAINNPTSTKQTLNNATDLVVLAGDDSTKRYLHNTIDIGPPDTTAPQTAIDSGPSGASTSSDATFTFSADEPGAVFACRLDGGDWAGCSSPTTYTGLTDGTHTFEVRATDAAGNVDDTPAIRSWSVDAPLDTFITTQPSSPSGSPTAEFTFFATDPAAAFQCSLDGEPFSGCTSPDTVSGLAAGAHAYEVRAVLPSGPDLTPAKHSWIVDPSLPLLLSPEADADVASATPTTNYGVSSSLRADTSPAQQSYLRFTVDGAAGRTVDTATLRLYLTNGSSNAPAVYSASNAWTETGLTWDSRPSTTSGEIADAASAPAGAWVEYDVASAITGDGTYTFAVLPESSDGVDASSREAASNQPQLDLTFSYADTTPPETSVDSGPSGTVSTSEASFGFSSNEPGSTFECDLDGAGWSACTSPVSFVALADGIHTFSVRATDVAGNVDASPATRTWTVEAPLETVIGAAPPVVTSSTTATFEFSSNRPAATFECALDGAGFAACTSPTELVGLGVGAHRFEVRAMGSSGQPDATPARHDWTVDPDLTFSSEFAATADALVRSEKPTANAGSGVELRADTSPAEESYLKFDVTGVSGVVSSAKLRLFVTNGSFNAPRVHTTGTGWTENGITWNTRPPVAATATADLGTVDTGVWVEYDVTSAVTGDGTVSFAFVPESSDGIFINSREAATSTPQLLVDWMP